MRVMMAMSCDSVINDFFIISFHRSIWMLRAEKILYFITWLNFNFITPLGITDSYNFNLQTFRISFELPAVKKLQKFESSPSIESPVMPLVSPWPIKMRLFLGKNNAKSA